MIMYEIEDSFQNKRDRFESNDLLGDKYVFSS